MVTILFIIIFIIFLYFLIHFFISYYSKKDMKIPFLDVELISRSITEKKLPVIDDRYGCYYVTGKQGSGKSYYAVQLILKQDFKKVNKIYTNVKSLNIPNYEIIYFDRLEQVSFNTERDVIFLIDEMARRFKKDSKTDAQFYAFLNQCRKHGRILIMITQEWKELPMWLRRPARYSLSPQKSFLSFLGIYKTVVGDAENMVLDEDLEWVCPRLKTIYYKRNIKIASYYDTFESINIL